MSAPIKNAARLHDYVVDVLIGELRSGQLAPGKRLTEDGLALRLGTSRSPIRIALNHLVKRGFLQTRRHGGYIVPSAPLRMIPDIIAVRMLLELPAVRMAAAEYGAEEVNKITKAIEFVAAMNDHHPEFAHENGRFYRAVFEHISNQMLWNLINQFANHRNFIDAATVRNMRLHRKIVHFQCTIRDAIDSRDANLAEDLWRSYLRFSEDALATAVDEC